MSFPTFSEFFRTLWGYDPFPWQTLLAERVSSSEWPVAIDLPTSSGKTSCLDAALYALAIQAEMPLDERTAPRRIWFVVDRRIVVDEAFNRAEKIAYALRKATDGPLMAIADRLRLLSGFKESSPPLAVGRLRGGVLRDDGWARLPSQPAILTSTVDQIGSRLLFRGYGFSNSLAPMHAGLAANDSLIILDEAHCSVPFLQTLRSIQRFRSPEWAQESIPSPFAFAVMSATLKNAKASPPFPHPDEREAALDHPLLHERGSAAKRAEIAIAKAPGKPKKGQPGIGKPVDKDADPLVLAAAQRALEYVQAADKQRVAVMVNRVDTAASIHAQLTKDCGETTDVILLTGRMRSFDRDALVKEWDPFLRASNPETPEKPIIIVTTQCLEVGADYSFDALITECASLDALRQRFGRLDRLGKLRESPALILIRPQDIKRKEDPIYGYAMVDTWKWLQTVNQGESVDFGIKALDALLKDDLEGTEEHLFAISEDAPILLPAHLDALCQTSPEPEHQPDIDLFLHGKRRSSAEVHVIWRADLVPPTDNIDDFSVTWVETVSLLPPTSQESLRVPLHRLCQWLAKQDNASVVGDIEGILDLEESKPLCHAAHRPFLLWRGSAHSIVTRDLNKIRPGDRIVLPESLGMKGLGYALPNTGLGNTHLDLAELAGVDVRRHSFLRLTPSLLTSWHDHPGIKAFFLWLAETDGLFEKDELHEQLLTLNEPINDSAPETIQPLPDWFQERLAEMVAAENLLRFAHHPDGKGLILIGPKPDTQKAKLTEDVTFADEDDITSRSVENSELSLKQHTCDVLFAVEQFASRCLPSDLTESLREAACVHDLGKLDPRFQLLLRNGDEVAAFTSEPLAKSRNLSHSRAQRRRLREQSKLPEGFRHEALSWQFVQHLKFVPPAEPALIAHLVATHHGHARPLHPVVIDKASTEIDLNLVGIPTIWNVDERSVATAAHRLDSGIAETFWLLNRRFGWWGLAYVESVFRFADWYASQHPGCSKEDNSPFASLEWEHAPEKKTTAPTSSKITFTGLDGANPLGYLAALGVLHVLTYAHKNKGIRMVWIAESGGWRPQIHAKTRLSEDNIIETLQARAVPLDHMFSPKLLEKAPKHGPKNKKGEASWADKLKFPLDCFRDYLAEAIANSSIENPIQAEWAAAWAGETCTRESSKALIVTRTRFDFTAGQQCFISMLHELRNTVTPEDIRSALFGPWRYSTSATSLRWDPLDEKRQYALQAFDPTNASANPSLAEPGANFLAIEGLPFFSFAPDRHASQPGFIGSGDKRCFHWRIWESLLPLDVVRSVITLSDQSSDTFAPLGIRQILQSAIVMPSGRYRNFTPAKAV